MSGNIFKYINDEEVGNKIGKFNNSIAFFNK